jgi:hypothetical protein
MGGNKSKIVIMRNNTNKNGRTRNKKNATREKENMDRGRGGKKGIEKARTQAGEKGEKNQVGRGKEHNQEYAKKKGKIKKLRNSQGRVFGGIGKEKEFPKF